jgi:hypothetical protein
MIANQRLSGNQTKTNRARPIILPWLVQSGLEAAARVLLEPGERSDIDFSRPTDEPARISPHSVSWHVCKNPLADRERALRFEPEGRSGHTPTRRVSAAVARLRER